MAPYEKEKWRLLVIDDVRMNAQVLTDLLREEGYLASGVAEIAEANIFLKEQIPDLILLDVHMPKVGGFEYYRQLKKDIRTSKVPVIFMSAASTPALRCQCYQMGAVDFIEKPYDIEEVSAKVKRRLNEASEKKQLELYNKNLYKLLNQQLRNSLLEQKNMIQALSSLVAKSEHISKERINAVANNCRLLSIGLQFNQDYEEHISNSFPDMIELVTPFRDIGLITFNTGELGMDCEKTQEQLEQYRQHTVIGASMFYEIQKHNLNSDLWQVAYEVTMYHHEQWNGSGYPIGLSGKDIPLSARIVSIIDCYDVLTHATKQRKAYSREEAAHWIEKESGQLFDPGIVNLFLRICHQFA